MSPGGAAVWAGRVLTVASAVGAVLLVVAVYRMDPASGRGPLPPCWFKVATGWDCPGCGGTRSLHFLLRGEIVQAFRHHPLLVALFPVVLLGITVALATGRRGFPPHVWALGAFAFLLGAAAFGVVRNLPAYPFPLP